MNPTLRSLDWKTALGLLALAAFVLLASPGVRVARGEPLDADGAQCRAGAPHDAAPELSHLLDRQRAAPGPDAAALRRELEAR